MLTCVWYRWNWDVTRQLVREKSTDVSNNLLWRSRRSSKERASEFSEQGGWWRFTRVGISFVWRHCLCRYVIKRRIFLLLFFRSLQQLLLNKLTIKLNFFSFFYLFFITHVVTHPGTFKKLQLERKFNKLKL